MTDKLKRINLEVTSNCNYLCVGCPTHNLLRGKGVMNIDLYKSIFNEVGNKIERVFLWNYGEPLLHPRIDELINYAKNFSAKKIMSTTGWKLEDLENVYFLKELDELIISIDGITPEVYNQYQINGDLGKVIGGLERISQIMSDSHTKYIMQIVAHKGNLKQIPLAEDFARKYGFDELVIKSFNVMDQNQETFDRFVPVKTKFSRYKKGFNNAIKKPINKIYPCEESMVIDWDGSVNPCCWDYKGENNFGNVSNEGVYAVWNSRSFKLHRERIKQNNFLKICTDCASSKIISTTQLTDKGGEDVRKSI